MNSFVRNPGLWVNPVDWKHWIIEKSELNEALRSLYGFNLWFAAEKDMNDIRSNVVKTLLAKLRIKKWLDEIRDCNIVADLKISIMSEVEKLLDDSEISNRASRYVEYKIWVEERAASSEFSIY